MARVRTDNVFGTITDSPLTAAATTMNSAGLANLAAVSSAEAIIILDPNRVSGAPEIVVVTAHTGSATSATIVRGQFGTAAREHAAGTEWVHGPIASNATSYATAADDQGDYVPTNAWATWSPTLTNMTQGNGTVTAKFVRIGTTIHFRFHFVLGSSSAVGTGPRFTLPVAPLNPVTSQPYGNVSLLDAGVNSWIGQTQFISGSTVLIVVTGAATPAAAGLTITATVPFTWATGDAIFVEGTYEAAS